jgi:hypothetical protein
MLWKGNWRRPVLVAAVVYGTFFVVMTFGLVEEYTPPDKRTIYVYGIAGTDVYCNGVHLGQLTRRSFKIRVDELMAKVPEWDTPPEQRWYDDTAGNQRLVTWIPWDEFRRERFEAGKKLYAELYESTSNRNASNTAHSASKALQTRREALLKHDAGCRYWWSARHGDSQMAIFRPEGSYHRNHSFDQQSNYHNIGIDHNFSPSVGLHAQLLVDVLPELTPEQKTDWDQHVLKHWSLLGEPLKGALDRTAARHRRDKNEPLTALYETALHSTARLKYGLSDPPTEDECRRLLADWVAESVEYRSGFSFDYDQETQYAPKVNYNVLLPADINETMRKPLAEQWRNKWRRTKWSQNGLAPVAYYSWQNQSPAYFADFARWSATTRKARFALLDNESPNTVALFNTLLHRRSLMNLFNSQILLYPEQINTYSQVNNPLVEADMRKLIVDALSDPKHNTNSRSEVERRVVSAIFQRIYRENIDKDEFSAWIASLPIPASSKNLAQRILRLRNDRPLTFADRLQEAAGQSALVETELTLDDVVQWFNENPEGMLHQFFKEQEENILVDAGFGQQNYREVYSGGLFGGGFVRIADSNRREDQWHGLPHCLALALLRSDTPEGNPQVRELIRQIWKRDWSTVGSAIATEYGTVDIDLQQWNRFGYAVSQGPIYQGSIYLPEWILDLYLSSERVAPPVQSSEVPHYAPRVDYSPRVGEVVIPTYAGWFSYPGSTLAFCESPKAEEILEKWLNEVSEEAKKYPERCLEIWRTRNALRQRKMEVLQDRIAGRMSPDELLLPKPAWVWKDAKYVKKPE